MAAGPLTVVVALAGRVGQDHLHAAVGGVVRPLALLAKHVADAVGVRLVELRSEGRWGRRERGGTMCGPGGKMLGVIRGNRAARGSRRPELCATTEASHRFDPPSFRGLSIQTQIAGKVSGCSRPLDLNNVVILLNQITHPSVLSWR